MKDYRMAYDPDPSYREKRRGLRWYSVVAFLAVMVLLIINIQAMRDNTRAENRRADAAEAQLVIQERMAQLMDEQNQREASDWSRACLRDLLTTDRDSRDADGNMTMPESVFLQRFDECFRYTDD